MPDSKDVPRHMHEGETLRLIDLADERGVIENHDFLRCTIQGPALVAFNGGTVHENRLMDSRTNVFMM